MILCLGRTGSTHLVSMLDHHSQATCFGEIFGDGKPPSFATAPEPDPAAFLKRLLASGDGRAVGFKLPVNSIRLTPAAADLVASDPGIHVIRLSRGNRLAQIVSRKLLQATGVSQSIFGTYGDAQVEIDAATLPAALDRIEAEEAELDTIAGGKATFRILYEELGDADRLNELQRFLGLDPEPLRSWFERLRTRPMRETVSNWGDVEAALAGTPHEALLRQDDV